jgi:Putative DNA-binding domain
MTASFDPQGHAQECVEARRQQHLLALLRYQADTTNDDLELAGSAAAHKLGVAVYRANAAALATRALGAAYPTVALLVGTASFAAMARAFWLAHPPQRGDLAWWGEALPAFIANDRQLDGEPYLADVARLEWAVHRAGLASDDDASITGLSLLGDAEPAHLQVRLRTGTAIVVSAFPIVEIWRAHHAAPEVGGDALAPARAALLKGHAQAAWVTRAGGHGVQVLALDHAQARLTQALLEGQHLEQALTVAGDGVAFEAWLIQALRHNALAAVQRMRP